MIRAFSVARCARAAPVLVAALIAGGCASDERTLPVDESVPVVEAGGGEGLETLARVDLRLVGMEVSSQLGEAYGVTPLADGNPETFWEVQAFSASRPDWVRVDLGEGVALAVGGVIITPASGRADQLWTRPPILQASQDGVGWEWLAYLSLDKQRIAQTGEPAIFVFRNERAFRHYRLLIDAGDFSVLGDLELFARRAEVLTAGLLAPDRGVFTRAIFDQPPPAGLTPLTILPAQMAASGFVGNESPANLIDRNPATFWHLPLGAPPRQGWVQVDFGAATPQTIVGLRVTPRAGFADQLWRVPVLFEGSDDGQRWRTVAKLAQRPSETPPTSLTFLFDNNQPYRWYRLNIVQDPTFYSFGDLDLYVRGS